MSAGQRKRARELVNSCVRNDSKRNKISHTKQPSRHNNENKNLFKTSLIDEGIKKDKVIKPKQTSQHNIDPTDLVKSSLKEDVIKREKIFETKRSNNLPIEVETIDQSSKAEVIDSPLITIPSITDEELNMAIQSISNDNSFGIPDTLLVDCSVDGLVDEKVIFCEESVPISNNVDIQQFDDYVGSRSNSPDSETSEHVKVITTAMVHSSSPKKLLSNNSLKSSAKISEVVCKENIVPTNILTIVCEKNTPSAKENCINLDKEAPEKLVNSDSSSKNLENIYLHSIEKEPNIPSIEENNIIVDDSVPVNQDSKQTEEVKYIQNTKEIKIYASKNLQEQKETIHSKSTEEKTVITIKANIQEQGIMIDNMNDKTNKYFDNIEVRPIEEVNIPEQKKMVDKIDNIDITSKNLDNNVVRPIEEVNANVLEQEKMIDKIANKDITSKNFENIAVRPIEEGNANAPEQEKNVDEIGNTDTTSKNIENIEVRPIEENINISRIQDIDITVDKNILEEEVEEEAVDDINNTFEDVDFIPVEENLGTTFDNTEKRPSRGRKRISADQNREIRKKRTNTNEDYVSAKGKEIKSKTFSGHDFHCLCPKKCTEKLSAENRKAEFDKFWKAGSFEARCALLQGYVKETNKKRSYSLNSRRTFTRKYYIQDLEVCKKTFLNTLSISQARIDSALIKNRNKETLSDKRGVNSGGKNKISTTQLNEMRDFIDSLPRYVSHYCRNSSTSNYLAPNLNLPILYKKYKEKAEDAVSFSRFRQCFMKDFNLKFKKPQKDTCLRCDTYKANISGANSEQKALYNTQHKEHLDHAYSLRDQMKSDLALAKSDALTETLTFDLEKTHSLPRLPTSVVYYKRQLNLYNLGIHCGSTKKGYFYVWLEHEAGRGTQEVGSCIRKFIQENLKSGVTHLILWSDSCGGQNRSIKMVLVLLHILQNHPTLEKVTLRFLQPGHTFLPNDSEFGDVECALKTQPRLYTADDFIEVMQNCRRKNKFQVTRVTKDDFFSIETILNQITNRKTDTQKNKISWLDTFEIQLKKSEPTKLYMKSKLQDEAKIVDIGKGGKGRKKQIDFENPLPLLHPEGRELSAEKIKDLKDILKLIPSDAKPFYNFLKNVRVGEFTDDVDGFGTSIDFEIEEFSPSE